MLTISLNPSLQGMLGDNAVGIPKCSRKAVCGTLEKSGPLNCGLLTFITLTLLAHVEVVLTSSLLPASRTNRILLSFKKSLKASIVLLESISPYTHDIEHDIQIRMKFITAMSRDFLPFFYFMNRSHLGP